MSSENTVTNDSLAKIVLRDPQSLLQQSVSENVVIIEYKTSSFIPPGENYGSFILKVDARIKKTKKLPEEELSIIAKMMPLSELQRAFVNGTVSFKKEIFMFEKLINEYNQIEKNSGIPSDELFDILPKYYGGRLSLNKNNSEADDDAVLLMENLKISGYYCANRHKGLDLEHTKLAIASLARFHALGITLKHKKPDFFEEAKEVFKTYPYISTYTPEFEQMIQANIDMICSDPRVAKYEDLIRKYMNKVRWDYLQHIEVSDPWKTIIHGDFWTNNIMFHKINDKVDGIKFVDFQVTQVSSPCKDLPYFLSTTLGVDILQNNFKELLDDYYDNLIVNLEKTGCDTSTITRDGFYKQMKKDAPDELFHCLMAIKFFIHEPSDNFDMNDLNNIFTRKSNVYMERVWQVIAKFVEMEWI